ncbi:MAG: adenosylcobinamide-GDP ribazoletransferase [Shimia sp.]
MTPTVLHDLAAATGLLTRLPVPVDGDRAMERGARSAWAYPLVGLLVGLILAGVGWVLLPLGAPLAAALALAVGIVITGALHEDGLADCADGFWGGYTKDRRLEIMADSRIGTYGVLALGLSLLIRWQAMALLLAISPLWLILAPALSRAAMVPVMQYMDHARPGGLSARVGKPGQRAELVSFVLILAINSAFGLTAIAPALAVTVVTLGCPLIAQRKIEGQTGDVLGATQQLTEMAALVALVAVLTT